LAFIASHFEYHFVVYYFRGRPVLKQQPNTHTAQPFRSECTFDCPLRPDFPAARLSLYLWGGWQAAAGDYGS